MTDTVTAAADLAQLAADNNPVTFGWDASHYDGTLTKAIMLRAYREGIRLFTHKIGESLSALDPTAGTALAAARDAGIPVLGGYWFGHGRDNPVAEAKAFIAAANRFEPWWPEFPCWFWQPDLETNAAGLPSPAWAKTFCTYLYENTGRNVVPYASRGMYGNRLTGLGFPLWNADYGSNPHSPFAAAYPGNNSRGWAPYSGQTPRLLQYGSNLTIAGLSTCDGNAYRGTVSQLIEWIGRTMTPADIDALAKALAPVIDARIQAALAPIAAAVEGLDIVTNPWQRTDSPGHTPPGNNPTTRVAFAQGDTWQRVCNIGDQLDLLSVKLSVPASPRTGE